MEIRTGECLSARRGSASTITRGVSHRLSLPPQEGRARERKSARLALHPSHLNPPSTPTRHSLSSSLLHLSHLRQPRWYLLPLGPTTVSCSVARSEQPAQRTWPPRFEGGFVRREKMDGSRAGLEEGGGEVWGGGACLGGKEGRVGRRVEREDVSASEAKKGDERIAGEGEAGGGAHCKRGRVVRNDSEGDTVDGDGPSDDTAVPQPRQILSLRAALPTHRYTPHSRSSPCGKTCRSKGSSRSVPRRAGGRSQHRRSHPRRVRLCKGKGIQARQRRLRPWREKSRWRGSVSAEARTVGPDPSSSAASFAASQGKNSRTHLLMPPPPLRLGIPPGSQPLLAPSAAETIAVHDLSRLGQLDKLAVAERAVADRTRFGVARLRVGELRGRRVVSRRGKRTRKDGGGLNRREGGSGWRASCLI